MDKKYMKRLIVNADDFGRAPGVNQGILDAHRNGIVTSTTVMINYPDAPAGLERALTETPDLGIGLHLNLTSGKPVSAPDQIPTLVDEGGCFYPPPAWATQFEAIDAEHVQREIEAQFQRFIDLTGHAPDHLDAHHHITYFQPDGLRKMLAISEHYAIPMRSSRITMPEEAAVRSLMGLLRGVTEPFARELVVQLRTIVAEAETPFWPARFEMGFFDEHATLGDLLVILTNLPDDSVTELMCHPGYPDDVLAGSGYTDRRAEEIAHLTHAATRECIESEGITLITFGDLAR
jgi:predicted glycoside hydrolase/deacetylase ChbG (UPF0249 family)